MKRHKKNILSKIDTVRKKELDDEAKEPLFLCWLFNLFERLELVGSLLNLGHETTRRVAKNVLRKLFFFPSQTFYLGM